MYTAQEQDLINRANRSGQKAIGLPYTIKLAESGRANQVTVTGVIVECGFGFFKRTPRSIIAVFKVVMECGANKTRREFHVKSVPQQ